MSKLNKLKAILYIGLGFVSALVAFLVCFFGIGQGWLYSVSWGLFFGGIGAVFARTIFHLYTDDSSAVMWQVSIYGFVACLGWLGCILCASYTWMFVWVALIVAMALMLGGVRFIDGWWLIREPKKADSLIESLAETARYKFIEDDPVKGEDTSRPLCAINDKVYTVVEAEAEGFNAIASNGRAYLKKVAKALDKKNKKENE